NDGKTHHYLRLPQDTNAAQAMAAHWQLRDRAFESQQIAAKAFLQSPGLMIQIQPAADARQKPDDQPDAKPDVTPVVTPVVPLSIALSPDQGQKNIYHAQAWYNQNSPQATT